MTDISQKQGGWTPGPWIVIPARPHEEIDGAYEAFAGIEGADGSPVCVFGDASGSATMFENAADYALIAAAPELYEALEASEGLPGLLVELEFCLDEERGEVERAIADIQQQVRAALSRANPSSQTDPDEEGADQ